MPPETCNLDALIPKKFRTLHNRQRNCGERLVSSGVSKRIRLSKKIDTYTLRMRQTLKRLTEV
jgi:hypothetical protein